MNKIYIICLLSAGALQAAAQNTMKVQSGATIKTTAGAIITLQDMNLDNDGDISQATGEGGFRFSGTTDNTIGGSSIPQVDLLQLAKTGSAKISLLQNLSIGSSISFTSGLMDLNNKNITLQPAAIINGESENSHIISTGGGYIETTAVLNNPNLENPGNLGATITSSANMGSTIIRRGHLSQANGSGTGNSILRYYDIIPANNTGLNATLNFSYLDNELNGLAESQLTLWKSTDMAHWTDMGFDRRSTVTNYVEQSGLTDFSRWTLSSAGNPLPLQFLLFNTKCEGDRLLLQWKTAQESNTGHFEIQQTADGINWTTIGILPAAGNSIQEQMYSYAYNNPPTGTNYYRVKETDIDGRANYTGILRSTCGDMDTWKLWPNPSREKLFISITIPSESNCLIKIVDTKGALVLSQTKTLLPGTNQIQIDTNHLLPGTYIAVAQYNGGLPSTYGLFIKTQ